MAGAGLAGGKGVDRGFGLPRLRELCDPTRAVASVKLHFIIVNICQTHNLVLDSKLI